MSNVEQLDSKQLLKEAEEFGLLGSNANIECSHCRVVFPKEYHKCPQCSTSKTIDVSIDWCKSTN